MTLALEFVDSDNTDTRDMHYRMRQASCSCVTRQEANCMRILFSSYLKLDGGNPLPPVQSPKKTAFPFSSASAGGAYRNLRQRQSAVPGLAGSVKFLAAAFLERFLLREGNQSSLP